MKYEAPDFNRSFPSRGERIGPAWQAVWSLLAERPGSWVPLEEVESAALSAAEIKTQTLKTLLWGAERAQLIEKRYGRNRNNRVSITHVKISEKGLSSRAPATPEEPRERRGS